MSLTTAQRVRLKIADAPRIADLTRYGDGMAVTFTTEHVNLTSGSAFVPNGAAWTSTGATFNASGFYTFANVISANSAYRVSYVHSIFSDAEIDQFLEDGGSVVGAAVEAVGSLMFDAMRCSRWMASDGSSYDNTSSQSHARSLYDKLLEELEREATTAGSFQSWALNQDGW
jgi:hypothetical protein